MLGAFIWFAIKHLAAALIVGMAKQAACASTAAAAQALCTVLAAA
jgi:hypothetical protein